MTDKEIEKNHGIHNYSGTSKTETKTFVIYLDFSRPAERMPLA